MQTCRLELMGLHDVAAYRRHASNLLTKANSSRLLSGWNIPNKKPGEPLLEWASTLLCAIPDREVTVHYSLKHQRSAGDPSEIFAGWCQQMTGIGVSRVLLVTGPRGPQRDAVWVLERLAGRHPAVGKLRLGVAFNACLPTELEREQERSRLVRKLKTGLVDDVWFNTGVDEELLERGITFVRGLQAKLGVARLDLFASAMLPSQAQLEQMRERPWNGVQFSDEFLESVQGMGRATSKALAVFRKHGVEAIIESKVKNREDLNKLEELLCATANPLDSCPVSLSSAYPSADFLDQGSSCVLERLGESQALHKSNSARARGQARRWGRGAARA